MRCLCCRPLFHWHSCEVPEPHIADRQCRPTCHSHAAGTAWVSPWMGFSCVCVKRFLTLLQRFQRSAWRWEQNTCKMVHSDAPKTDLLFALQEWSLLEGIILGTVMFVLIRHQRNSVLAEKKSFLSSSSTLFPPAHWRRRALRLEVWIWDFPGNRKPHILTLCLWGLYVDVLTLWPRVNITNVSSKWSQYDTYRRIGALAIADGVYRPVLYSLNTVSFFLLKTNILEVDGRNLKPLHCSSSDKLRGTFKIKAKKQI